MVGRHDDINELPIAEFAFPGPLRDQLVAAILDGRKTSTTSLLVEYQVEDEPLPQPGQSSRVIDSQGVPVAIITVTSVSVGRLDEVSLDHVIDEGEGYFTRDQWRRAHEAYWHSREYREALGDPEFVVSDDTLTVYERFRVIDRLSSSLPPE